MQQDTPGAGCHDRLLYELWGAPDGASAKKISTLRRGALLGDLSYRSLGCQSQSAKIISSKSPRIQLFIILYHAPFFSCFPRRSIAQPQSKCKCFFGSLHKFNIYYLSLFTTTEVL